MLQLIRDRAQGIVVWVIVGLIIITFALFGLSSYLSGSAKVNVAEVNGVEISQTEFLRAYQNYQERLQKMFGKSYKPEMFNDDVIKQQVLDGMVTREVLSQALDSKGFTAAPQQILSRITAMDSFKDETGKFSNKQYKRMLAMQGMNSAMFESRIAQDIADEHLYAGLSRSVFVAPWQVDSYKKLQGQKRDIEYLQIKHQNLMQDIDVTEEEVSQYYSKHSAEFTTPEMVSIEYIDLNINNVAKQFAIDEAAIRQHYEQNISLYESTPEQRKASHILITTGEDNDAAQARKLAEELVQRINKGESFAELAKQYSKDPGSANNGGDLGYFGKGVMDKAFEEAVFAMDKGQVSEPVKSDFGYHIIKLTDIKPGKVTPFEEVKSKIKKDLQLQKAEQQFYTDIDKLNNLTYETPDSLRPAAEALGLEIKQSELFTRDGGKGVLAEPKVVAAAFADEVLKRGHNSEMIELSDTHLLVLRNKQHKPASALTLEQVRSRIVTSLKRDKAVSEANKLASSIVAKLNEGDTATAVAKTSAAIDYHKPGLIARKPSQQSSQVNAGVRQAAFRMPKPDSKVAIQHVPLVNGDQAVIILNKVVEGTDIEQAEQQQLVAMYGNASYDGYVDYLKSQADIKLYTENIKQQQ